MSPRYLCYHRIEFRNRILNNDGLVLRSTLGLLLLFIVFVGCGHENSDSSLGRQDPVARPSRAITVSIDKAPQVGEVAPNFVLKSIDGSQETELSSFHGKRPVVLIFGSYT